MAARSTNGAGTAATRGHREGWRELFWIVFSRSASPMMVLDSDRRVVETNAAMIESIRYSREDLLGHRIDLFLDPDEWRSLDADWRAFQRRGEFEGQRSLVRPDGRRVEVQYAAWWALLEGRRLALYVALEVSLEPQRLVRPGAALSDALTARELQVVGLVAMGRRAHEIADELGIAPSTVRSHVRRAMRKVGARSQAQLVAIVCACGMLDVGVAA
ncbi:MAG: LuxR C-terminal-related transcriptional regulator [Solirubrobacteraceae bacterium]|jgi:PAS domain S-box-containing protein